MAFGGAVLPDVAPVVQAMLRGFADLPPQTTVVWFETNPDRYECLRQQLAGVGHIQLTTQQSKIAAPRVAVPQEPFVLQVSLEQGELAITGLPPAGSAVAFSWPAKLTAGQLATLAAGGGHRKRTTPDLKTLRRRGMALAKLLFGDDAAELLQRCRQSHWSSFTTWRRRRFHSSC